MTAPAGTPGAVPIRSESTLQPAAPEPSWSGETLPAPPLGLLAVWLAAWASRTNLLVVIRSERRLRALAPAVQALAPAAEVLALPPWDCLPYDRAPPSRAVMGERMTSLRLLARPAPAGGRVVLTTAEALAQRVPPRAAAAEAVHRLAPGEALDLVALRRFLLRTGHVVDERVDEPGEAAFRGAVVDLFPADAARPCRLELDEGRIAAIRAYDPLTQRSLDEVEELTIGAAAEIVLPEGADAELPVDAHQLPLRYPEIATLLDHLPDARLVLDPFAEQRWEAFAEQVQDAYAARRSWRQSEAAAGAEDRLVEPGRLYLDAASLGELIAARPHLRLEPQAADGFAPLPAFRRATNPHGAFLGFVAERLAAGERVVLAAADERDRRLLHGLIARRLGTAPEALPGWSEALDQPGGTVASVPLPLPEGFTAPGLAVVAATDVLAPRPVQDAARLREALLTLAELRPGDHVVHAEHGIGILRGLETVETAGAAGEHLILEYAGERRLLVPAMELDRTWRYGSAAVDVALDRLGVEAWQARCDEVAAQIEAAARALARIAHERARRRGVKLQPPREPYTRLVRRFAYEPSEDQAAAIEATLADLARGTPPMDRLVCGDVGFGKTEVALRAAAVAALAGRQVALLAPTTLLVRQHLETFRRRFAGLDVRVEQLSRLGRAKEAQAVRAGLADGSVRIVIGTHALASPQVRFQDLALVVIDEEQRFGTRHKEALRRLRREAHVLTMTATPIPRTLQAALAGVQELSVIATPPVRRQPVRTFVLPFDAAVVREALQRERRRGGRSFVVVPRIADLAPMAEELARIVPGLDVAVAHGRMQAELLDDTVLAFVDGRHDVLLATSIIETGLDMPGANTMIVWRAERFGVAQIHQLRGRVGRGRERAVCYLLHEPGKGLPPASEQRLRTLAAFEDLGAGFAISARDLDLRGAGDLVGEAQAGHVRLIGTGLYEHLLVRAIRRARGEPVADDAAPEFALGVGVLIPADYVPEPELRLDLYARLARLGDPGELDDLAEEIADRFGPLPDAVGRLLALAGIRARCRRLGIGKLEAGTKAAAATFRDAAAARLRWPQAGGELRWSGGRLLLTLSPELAEDPLAAAAALLDRLEGSERHAT
jgi:transcription-repair coupling factor (superfamily II helicase)